MKHTPLVSVLMTVYNRELYIAEAIESVLNQDYQNFELIIVDDCSKDESYAIADAYLQKDSRIKLYRNEVNLGDYPNRNKAASYANGKYLKYLDADDIIYPNSLTIMVSSMEEYPEAALGIQSIFTKEDKSLPLILASDEAIRRHYFNGGILLPGPSGVIILKNVFDSIGGFSGKRFVGDTECWIRIACIHKILILPASLVWWREHEGQEIKKESKLFEPVLVRYQIDQECFKDPHFPLTQHEKIVAKKKSNRRYLHNLLRLLIFKGKFGSAMTYYSKSQMGFINTIQAIFH